MKAFLPFFIFISTSVSSEDSKFLARVSVKISGSINSGSYSGAQVQICRPKTDTCCKSFKLPESWPGETHHVRVHTACHDYQETDDLTLRVYSDGVEKYWIPNALGGGGVYRKKYDWMKVDSVKLFFTSTNYQHVHTLCHMFTHCATCSHTVPINEWIAAESWTDFRHDVTQTTPLCSEE